MKKNPSSDRSEILEQVYREDTEAPKGGAAVYLLATVAAVLLFAVGFGCGWMSATLYALASLLGAL